MRRTRLDGEPCPVARTADLLGDWWSPLLLRELLFGRRRFSELQATLGISRGVLAARLRRFEEAGIVVRERYCEAPPRDAYVLTEKGTDLWGVLVAMWEFGDRWLFDDGAPVQLVDRDSGRVLEPCLVDRPTGEPIDRTTTEVRLRR